MFLTHHASRPAIPMCGMSSFDLMSVIFGLNLMAWEGQNFFFHKHWNEDFIISVDISTMLTPQQPIDPLPQTKKYY